MHGHGLDRVGGDLLVTEVAVFKGKGKLTITGKLGEVMQESAQAALSYVDQEQTFLNLDSDFNEKNDIHIHVPRAQFQKMVLLPALPWRQPSHQHYLADQLSKDVAMTGGDHITRTCSTDWRFKRENFSGSSWWNYENIDTKENEKDILDIPKEYS